MLNFLNQIRELLNRTLASKWFLITYLTIYFIIISAVSVHRFWQFEYFYFDHGIFDSSLWQVARGRPPLIDHFEETGFLNQLGDHFTPVMYLLAPLYWLTSAYEPLILVQNLSVVVSAAVMWFLARKLKLPPLLSVALLVAYTWFVGLQNGLIAGFHTELLALLTLSLTFYFMTIKRFRMYWLFLFLTLGLKETFVAIAVAIGVYWLLKKKYWLGLTTILLSVGYFFLVTRWVIPAIGGQPYGYTSAPVSFRSSISALYQPPIKLQTTLISLASFGFLPIFDLSSIGLWLQDLLTRFVLTKDGFAWGFGFHYSVMSGLLLYFTAIKASVYLLAKKWYQKYYWLHAGVIIAAVFLAHFYLHGPLGLFFNRAFYPQSRNHQFLRDFIQAVPRNGLTMTQNNLAVQMTHTHQIMLLRDTYWRVAPDTIAIDIRPGQNPNNFWPIETKLLYDKLVQDPNYQLHEFAKEQVYFTKKANFDPEFYYKVGWEKR